MGTQSAKGLLYDAEYETVSFDTCDYKISSKSMANYLNRDINIYWECTINLIRSIIRKKRIKASEIKAISFSVLGESFVPTDENFCPVYTTISGHDTRGSDEVKIINSNFDNNKLQQISGQPNVEVFWPAVKILWLFAMLTKNSRQRHTHSTLTPEFTQTIAGCSKSRKILMR